MKKIISIFLFIIILTNNVYAEWIYSDITKCWYYLDTTKKQFYADGWYDIYEKDDKNTNKMYSYYFNKYGCLLVNTTTPDGKIVNSNGELVENGQVKVKTKIPTENKTNIDNPTDDKVLVNASGRSLKNYILDKNNVDIETEKVINGQKKSNVIVFKGNGSYIQINTKKYNKINLKIEKDKSFNNNVDYELKVMINGYEEDVIQLDSSINEMDYELKYKINDEVDLVMNYEAEQESLLSSSYKLYITSGRMSKYKENEDEDENE